MSASSPQAERLGNLLTAFALGTADSLEGGFRAEGFDSTSAGAVLALLDFAPAGSVQRLSNVIGLTHSGAVRLVDRLADDGLVERRAGDDLRSLRVMLTPAGRRAALRLRHRRAEVANSVLARLTAEQRDHFTAICEKAIGNLTIQRLAMRASGEAPSGGALCRLCDFAACGHAEGRCPSVAISKGAVGQPIGA